MMKRRLILNILAVSLLLSLALPAMATETTEATEETTEETVEETKKKYSMDKKGGCGDDLTWVLEGSTLTITGEGEMDDGCPWEFYKDTIETVIFNGDITTVGAGAFDSCNNLKNVYLGDALVEIGEKAFYSCNALETVLLPETFRKFGPDCFRDCENLEKIFCEGPMPSFKASCMYNNHTVVVYYSHQTPWPWEEVSRLMSNFGGRIYVQVGSAEEWEDVREEVAELRSENPVTVVEETTVETVPETVAVTEAAAAETLPVVTQPAVIVETAPAQVVETTVATEPVMPETQSTEPVELVFVEPEMDLDTGETEPKTLEENIVEKVAGFNWGWVIAGFGGLIALLVLALIIRGISHKGGKYSD